MYNNNKNKSVTCKTQDKHTLILCRTQETSHYTFNKLSFANVQFFNAIYIISYFFQNSNKFSYLM